MELPVRYKKLNTLSKRKVRNQYIRLQGGLCHYCKKPLVGESCNKVRAKPVDKRLFPKNFFDYPVHLHHNHTSGMTVGVVHAYCNAVLWQYHHE